MTIEQKLEELRIKRVLVVDDTAANIEAAKAEFAKYSGAVIFDYASSAADAKKKIVSQKYDLVMTDLEMESKDSGLEVVSEASKTAAYVTVVTGANYDRLDSDAHGPNTSVLPADKSMKGKKDKSEVWAFALEESLGWIESGDIQAIYRSAKRYEKFVGKVPDLLQAMVETYKR